MITANEAYAATTKVLEGKYVQERSNIEGYIKAAVDRGHYNCELNKLSDKLQNELIDAGYKVEHFHDKLKPNDEVTINVDLLATLMKLASGSSFDIGIHVGRNHCMTNNDFIKWRNGHIKALLTAGLGREVDDTCFPMYER